MRQRLSSIAQPVLWTAGVALLIVVLSGLFRNVGQPGSDDGPEETPTPALDETASAEATGTPEPCTAEAIVDTSVYAELANSSAVLGILLAGERADLLGQHIASDGAVWLQIIFQQQPGWIAAQDASIWGLCPTPPPTATLEGPAPTDTLNAAGECLVGPTEGAPDTHIYTGPGTIYPDFSKLAVGDYVPATGRFMQPGYDSWWRVDYQGQEGWVSSVGFEVIGDVCWSLPQVPVDSPPPTYTPSPTYPPLDATPTNPEVMTLTPMLPVDIPPADQINHVLSVGPDIGSTASMSARLPDEQGNWSHIIQIRIDGLPPNKSRENMRTIRFSFSCGSNTSPVRWDYYHGSREAYVPCGQPAYGRWLDWESNSLYLVVSIPEMIAHDSYMLTVTVDVYDGW